MPPQPLASSSRSPLPTRAVLLELRVDEVHARLTVGKGGRNGPVGSTRPRLPALAPRRVASLRAARTLQSTLSKTHSAALAISPCKASSIAVSRGRCTSRSARTISSMPTSTGSALGVEPARVRREAHRARARRHRRDDRRRRAHRLPPRAQGARLLVRRHTYGSFDFGGASGNASSIVATSCGVSSKSPARASASTWPMLDVFGIANDDGRRTR